MNSCASQQAALPEHGARRIFFLTGEQGVGKSTFLTALIKKFALRPSGFVTQKHTTNSQSFIYIHPVIDGSIQNLQYTPENCAGLCQQPKPTGFPAIFDSYGVKVLRYALRCVRQGTDSTQRFILMDELGIMENDAHIFCKEVCSIFAYCSVIGVVKPRGTVFFPILEKIPTASIFRLTLDNRQELYTKLENAQTVEEFFCAVQ